MLNEEGNKVQREVMRQTGVIINYAYEKDGDRPSTVQNCAMTNRRGGRGEGCSEGTNSSGVWG